jgi:hypothetical protein
LGKNGGKFQQTFLKAIGKFGMCCFRTVLGPSYLTYLQKE